MIGMTCKTKDNTAKVLAKARQGTFKSLGHAGASIRLVARRSIRRGKSASPEGQPPRTRRGQLRGAILFAVEARAQRVVIGPAESKVGTSGHAHEFGGRYRRERYPKRPFMGPAFDQLKNRLPALWAGSVR